MALTLLVIEHLRVELHNMLWDDLAIGVQNRILEIYYVRNSWLIYAILE